MGKKTKKHIAQSRKGLGMAWIGQKAAKRWDESQNNKELETALSIAQEMEIQDKDPLTIKMATGWERGADMEWRYEMPDFFWKQKILNQAYSYGTATPFSALVKDDRLLTMYPELKDYNLFVKLLPPGSTTLGYFDEANKTLVVPIINGDANYDLESVLIHETQHFIQRIEGFERGSNPQAAGGFLNYQRTSGEVEARNAQKRRHMKSDERRKSLWSDTVEPEHKNAETHLYPTKDASRKQHQQDLDKKKQAHRSRDTAPASPTSSPTTQESENAKAKRKRKQLQQALALEIALQLAKKTTTASNPNGAPLAPGRGTEDEAYIYLHIDYLDPDFDTAKKLFPKRVIFGDFFAEGEHRGAEYLWAKTTHDEAAKVLPNYKKYIDTPGRWDRESLDNLNGIDSTDDYERFSRLFGKKLLDDFMRLIKAAAQSEGWITAAKDYTSQAEFLRDYDCIPILEQMADEHEQYYTAYYNIIDFCRNANIPKSILGDIVWNFINGKLNKK